jgi:cation transport ATPase
MDCADEAALLRQALDLPGITDLSFDLVGRRVDVSFDAATIAPATIVEAVNATGLAAHAHGAGEHVEDDHRHQPHSHFWSVPWIAASGVFWGIAWAAGYVSQDLGDRLYLASMAAGLRPVVPRAIASLRFRRLDMHVLVCLSAIGASAVGQWSEGAAVAFLFGFAHLLEAWSIERARAAVAALVGHEPGWGVEGRHQSASVERWIEKFAAIYTPVVTFSALAVVLLPPLIDGQWAAWLYRGLIFLVLACPCALVISTPVTVVAALTSAARRGVLFKGGAPLERAAFTKTPSLRGLADAGVVVSTRTNQSTPLEDVDVVMTCDHPEDLEFLVSHARRAVNVIRQNVAIALATKALFLVSALFGVSPLWLAVLADTGATVAVTLNGLRLLRA